MAQTLLPQRRWMRILVSLFILFHLVVIPLGSQLSVLVANRSGVVKFMADYVFATRLRQYWALFSPDPRQHALKYFAHITFKDGTTKEWIRPYPPNWDFFSRHLSYNFQKWDLVSNYLDNKSALWDSLGNYLKKLYWDDANPVVVIRYFRAFAEWPPPSPVGYVGGETNELKWTDQLVFTYDVRLEQLY